MQLEFNGCLRDFQDEAKKKGHPWTLAKVGFWLSGKWNIYCFILEHCQMFDTSLPVSPLIPLDALPDPHNVSLWCKVKSTPTWKMWENLICTGEW